MDRKYKPQGGFPPIILASRRINVDMNRGFSSTIVNIGDIINAKREKAKTEAFGDYEI